MSARDELAGNPYADENATYSENNSALVSATLALAFEQRTANLLAFWVTIPRHAMDEDTRALRKEILERLGL